MGKETPLAEERSRRSLIVPILLLSTFLATSISFFLGTVLVDIAATFKVSIGTASQLSIVANVMGIIMGFAMSSLSIRFKHKSLLLLGNTFFVIGTLGYFLAQNFATVILVSFLLGAGTSMMMIMVFTLIGEQLHLEKRGWAMGLVVSSIMTSGLLISFLSGLIDSIAGWRMVLLCLLFPISIICLTLGLLVIPSKQPKLVSSASPSFPQVLKRVFLNRSPSACVISILLVAFVGAFPLYAASFFRLTFAASPVIGGAILSLGTLGGMVGGVVGGRLINKYGRKKLAITAVFFCGLSNSLMAFMPVMWLSVVFVVLGGATMAMTITGLQSLSLEQLPEFRASMMSLGNTFENSGAILAAFVGGLVLNLFANNFHLLFPILGVIGGSAAAVLFFFAKDPCIKSSS